MFCEGRGGKKIEKYYQQKRTNSTFEKEWSVMGKVNDEYNVAKGDTLIVLDIYCLNN